MNQTRVNQLADRIHEIVAGVLERRVKDPRLGFMTITSVRLTSDLRDATIYYTVLGDPEDRNATSAALRSATGMLRTEVGNQLGLRHTPSLAFVPDEVPEQAERIEQLVQEARASDAELGRRAAEARYAGDPDPYRAPRDEDDADE